MLDQLNQLSAPHNSAGSLPTRTFAAAKAKLRVRREADGGELRAGCQGQGFTRAEAQAAARASVTAYREAMAAFAKQNTMAIWYASLDEAEITRVTHLAAESAEASEKAARKARR